MSTPIETNTEQLQEVLQQVYDLPNRSGDSTTPDLVVVVDGSTLPCIDDVNSNHVSIESGNIASAIQKIESGQPANVLLKLTVQYGGYTYHEVAYPESVGVVYNGDTLRGLTVMFRARYSQVAISTAYEILLVFETDGSINYHSVVTAT